MSAQLTWGTGYDNDRLRYIRLHGQVNALPDPNYATLKFFMGHLDKCVLQAMPTQSGKAIDSDQQGPALRGQESDVDIELVDRVWPDVTWCTARAGWAQLGAHEFPVQGVLCLAACSQSCVLLADG